MKTKLDLTGDDVADTIDTMSTLLAEVMQVEDPSEAFTHDAKVFAENLTLCVAGLAKAIAEEKSRK